MDLPAASGAATYALAMAAAFALVVRAWQAVGDRRSMRPLVAGAVMNEAAQRVRDRYRLSSRAVSTWLATGLVFGIVFATTGIVQRDTVLHGLPAWLQVVLLVLVGLSVAASVCVLARTLARRRALCLRKDAGRVTGHALQKLNGNLNRIFHDVPCSAGVIDHVVAGLHGIYAVQVIARRPGKDNRVRLREDTVEFATRHAAVSIEAFLAAARRLARECSKAVKHDIHVRCVVSLPGWEIGVQSNPDVLVVNERNLSMLTGWKDPRDYLLNEDVDTLQDLLTARCTRSDTTE